MLLGCIADDFTGATDLAGALVNHGMRTVQMIGVPDSEADKNLEADAVVIALKSRTAPAKDAIADSRSALDWLRAAGCRQSFFKYCSTFDSTDKGNIGPVAEALMAALDTDFTIFCPAFPENGRTLFKGYLFVGDVLLNESGMQDHPLTPMTDANLVRVLSAQATHRTGLIDHRTVASGADAIRAAYRRLRDDGVALAVVDAVSDDDLHTIGRASSDLPLITGGSGVVIGLPENFRRAGLLSTDLAADALPSIGGHTAVISGSCSRATQEQVEIMRRDRPAFFVDPTALADGEDVVADALEWAAPQLGDAPILVYATADPDTVRRFQSALGVERSSSLIEDALAAIARGLKEAGVRRLIVAGGETSGAVVSALAVRGLRIGPQIDPGVPWTASLEPDPMALALKSGNFGSPRFFLDAFDKLRRPGSN